MEMTSSTPTMSTNPQLDQFTFFPKLPLELRLRIWKDVSFLPRLVDTKARHLGQINGIVTSADLTGWRSTLPVPSIFHVFQESRKEGLRHYKLEFGSKLSSSWISVNIPAKVYVNFNADVVLLFGPLDPASEIELCQKPIRHLAFPVDVSDHHTSLVALTDLCGFRYLRLHEIILVPMQDTSTISVPFRLEPYNQKTSISVDGSNYYSLHSATAYARWELERKLGRRKEILQKFRRYCAGELEKATVLEGYMVYGINGMEDNDQDFVDFQKTRRFEKELKEYKDMMREDKLYGPWTLPEIRIMQLATQED
ncbi:hypothetical protein BKA61DRAFT_675060 [Leptodontidium sp. MPI-SDFR-AT-0119]|nr:hypothetical protein BKA61DRAFT_675060 [Leptodontidium sp. MPI-SDFR-AT-0119]